MQNVSFRKYQYIFLGSGLIFIARIYQQFIQNIFKWLKNFLNSYVSFYLISIFNIYKFDQVGKRNNEKAFYNLEVLRSCNLVI